jgi:quercetin dioxygenase-like cupin family protein
LSRRRQRRSLAADATLPEGERAKVLLSELERAAVVVDLPRGEVIGDHQLLRRVVMEVAQGRVLVESAGESREFAAGAIVIFDAGEVHTERAVSDARLIFDLQEDGFVTRERQATTPAPGSWLSTAPEALVCLAILGAVLLLTLVLFLSGSV